MDPVVLVEKYLHGKTVYFVSLSYYCLSCYEHTLHWATAHAERLCCLFIVFRGRGGAVVKVLVCVLLV